METHDLEQESGKIKEELIEVTKELTQINSEEGIIATAVTPDAFIDTEESAALESRNRVDRKKKTGVKRKVPDFILGDVYERAVRASDRLRSHLTGTVRLNIRDEKLSYFFDWTSENFSIKEDVKDPADCTIEIGQEDLLSISSGDLNAQISMLSHKVNVEGKMDLAVYFFNLITPPGK